MPNCSCASVGRLAALISLSLTAVTAAASCGQAYCVLNSNWSMQGVAADPGTGRLDLRYEQIHQTDLRHGTRSATFAEANQHHREVSTMNRNLVATYDHTFSSSWGFSISAPVVDREHLHIHNHRGQQLPESWEFTRLGDVRALAQRRFTDEDDPLVHYGIQFGLKLPTGDYKVKNSEGQTAERSLQPGSGSTDAVVGAYYTHPGPVFDSAWFVQGLYQQAVAIKDEFRPGRQLTVNAGYSHPLPYGLHAQIQLNALLRARDRGDNAETDLSGGRFLFVSPGLTYAISDNTQIYGFVQLPVYQRVNGTQLTADRAYVAGVSLQF